jgi:hypothetical protein
MVFCYGLPLNDLLLMILLLTIRAGTPGTVLRLQKACSDNLIVRVTRSHLGNGDF